VLINLVSNALKFTEQGRIDIDVTAGKRRGSICLAFTVSDTGIGIRPNNSAGCSPLSPRPTAASPAASAAPGWGSPSAANWSN
jgi:light-regulated signal transduction histidine kinase (bacteriophytochrome)